MPTSQTETATDSGKASENVEKTLSKSAMEIADGADQEGGAIRLDAIRKRKVRCVLLFDIYSLL